MKILHSLSAFDIQSMSKPDSKQSEGESKAWAGSGCVHQKRKAAEELLN